MFSDEVPPAVTFGRVMKSVGKMRVIREEYKIKSIRQYFDARGLSMDSLLKTTQCHILKGVNGV
jgi:hypothetical protein